MSTLIVDGNNLVAISTHTHQHLTGPSGMVTGGIFGTLKKLHHLLDVHDIDDIIFVKDFGRPAFRKELTNGEYKANRHKPDDTAGEEFAKMCHLQLAECWALLPSIGVSCVAAKGWEADDVIAYLCGVLEDKRVVICSGDQDMQQLVSERVWWYRPTLNETVATQDPHFLLFRCLTGDSSDNIAGVGGIGEMRAREIVYGLDKAGDKVADAYTTPDELLAGYRGRFWKKLELPDVQQRLWNNWKVMNLTISSQMLNESAGDVFEVHPGAYDERSFSMSCRGLGFRSILEDLSTFLRPFKACIPA